ncbi:MAG: DegT/DnrJ/EryC1/StrS family aminotransferase [Alphaproteobacteria bacterium]|nr:DegT/DnrJ/EryC1/StrS family aminotransferase [Alphaproteobacteria bacterium]
MTQPAIPQTDPGAAYRERKDEIDAAVARVLASGRYILGPEVEAFESAFAAWSGLGYAVGVANGTDALELALRGLDIGPGDVVATVSLTAVATVAAIELVGARAVLVDIDPFYGLDPGGLEAAIRLHKPKAVIPVHLYGQACAMGPIMELAGRHGFKVIEDCSQAHGASLAGRRVGSFGDVACYSLYPTKNLGALGDGGVIATGDAALATRLKALREYGWRERYISAETGMNSRLDPIQAAILRVKLAHLATDNARRAAIAAVYDRALNETAIAPPRRRPGAGHVFHQYVLRARDRDGLKAALAARGIGTLVHYPQAVHQQPAYRGRVAVGPAGLGLTDKAMPEILSLPMYPQLEEAALTRIAAALAELGKEES